MISELLLALSGLKERLKSNGSNETEFEVLNKIKSRQLETFPA